MRPWTKCIIQMPDTITKYKIREIKQILLPKKQRSYRHWRLNFKGELPKSNSKFWKLKIKFPVWNKQPVNFHQLEEINWDNLQVALNFLRWRFRQMEREREATEDQWVEIVLWETVPTSEENKVKNINC